MAATALRTFQQWYDAHQAADPDALAGVLHPDVTVRSLFRPEPVRGRDAAVAHFRRTLAAFPDLSMPLTSPAAANAAGVVLAEVRFTGTFTGTFVWRGTDHRGAGQPFDVAGVVVLHTDDDAVTAVATLFDRDVWLRHLGVAARTADVPDVPDLEHR
jgi:ketosteroid isomerase-like protein